MEISGKFSADWEGKYQMSSSYGKIFNISIFGESHSNSIGVVIDGVPSGVLLDIDEILFEMSRRAPGKNEFSTPRAESDIPEILSGVFNGRTTGTPICATIKNNNTRSKDYTPEILRPSHADYSGTLRYNGYNDYRGGGHFSGRLTAPLVFAGAIAKQILKRENIEVFSHIKNIGKTYDEKLDMVNPDVSILKSLRSKTLPFINEERAKEAETEILRAKENADSIGGSIEAVILGMPGGIGSPMFESCESRISSMLFSVPAVKAVEFGIGKEISEMLGSEANDSFFIENDIVKTKSNNNGGINGGITNGMPIILIATIKPTPSIGAEQDTVNIKTKENVTTKIIGRHDPCIVQRAVPVIEAALAISVLDLILEAKTYA